jgi:hypothetical protein
VVIAESEDRDVSQLLRAAVAICLALLALSGCSSPKQPGELSQEEKAIVLVGRAYRDASTALKRGPASAEELKPFLKKYGDPDQLLVSPNDGQPYHIVWGLIPSRPAKSFQTQPFLAYEKTGKDGKRYALDCMLRVHHLSDQEFTDKQGSR